MSARFDLNELIHESGGDLVAEPALVINGLEHPVQLNSDSRSLGPDDWFVPLKGERFDGHIYLPQALEVCAGAFVAETWAHEHLDTLAARGKPLVVVPDTLSAYQAMARHHRRCLAAGVTVIGLTGSAGKTTVKDMLAAAITPHKRLQASFKNHNNEIGVAQTLLGLEPDTKVLVVEMAMRGPGQIAELAAMAEPDIGLVLNAGEAHVGLLGSVLDIARAKCELVAGLDASRAVAIVNADDALIWEEAQRVWPATAKHPLIGYRLNDAQAHGTTGGPAGGAWVQIEGETLSVPVPGVHQCQNLMAVWQVGKQLGLSLAQLATGLVSYQSEGRWQPVVLHEGVTLIHDAYNANPASMRASLSALASQPGKRFAVLSPMNELGADGENAHEALGQWLAGLPLDGVWVYAPDDAPPAIPQDAPPALVRDALVRGAGDAPFPVRVMHTLEDVKTALLKELAAAKPAVTVLFKGSRGFKLEALIQQLQAQQPASVHPL